jgi:hypothetical protein
VGVSYTWDEGEAGLKTSGVAPLIGVRKVGEEVKVCFGCDFLCVLMLKMLFTTEVVD